MDAPLLQNLLKIDRFCQLERITWTYTSKKSHIWKHIKKIAKTYVLSQIQKH